MDKNIPDGSGISIQMEAPILRAAKNASSYTKRSYMALILLMGTLLFSYRIIVNDYAFISLQCDTQNCDLKIKPPRERTFSFTFDRRQLEFVQEVRVDGNGKIMSSNHSTTTSSTSSSSTSSSSTSYPKRNQFDDRYPDQNGHYKSYIITLRKEGKDDATAHNLKEELSKEITDEMMKYGSAAMTDPDIMEKFKQRERSIKTIMEQTSERIRVEQNLPDLSPLLPHCDRYDPPIHHSHHHHSHTCHILLRKYNIGETRRRVTALVSRIFTYIEGRRQNLDVRESRNVKWQGILLMIFSVFGLLITLIAGQFVEPSSSSLSYKRRKSWNPNVPPPSDARVKSGPYGSSTMNRGTYSMRNRRSLVSSSPSPSSSTISFGYSNN